MGLLSACVESVPAFKVFMIRVLVWLWSSCRRESAWKRLDVSHGPYFWQPPCINVHSYHHVPTMTIPTLTEPSFQNIKGHLYHVPKMTNLVPKMTNLHYTHQASISKHSSAPVSCSEDDIPTLTKPAVKTEAHSSSTVQSAALPNMWVSRWSRW